MLQDVTKIGIFFAVLYHAMIKHPKQKTEEKRSTFPGQEGEVLTMETGSYDQLSHRGVGRKTFPCPPRSLAGTRESLF